MEQTQEKWSGLKESVPHQENDLGQLSLVSVAVLSLPSNAVREATQPLLGEMIL